MGISRSTTVWLLSGLCLAGCESKPKPQGPTTNLADLPAAGPTSPSLSPEADAQRQTAVIDTVGDTVDRFDQIIRQREQAKQAATDAREARTLNAPPAAPAKADGAADPSTIEQLAAALRERKPIDPIPEAAPAGDAKSNAALASTDNVAPKTEDLTAGALASSVKVERNEPSPEITRSAAGDPMVAVQQKYASRVEADPRDLSAQLDLQMLRFLKDEPVPTMSDLVALPAEDRELISSVCDALSNFRSLVRAEPNPLNSEKARPFIEMADRIRNRADLTISGLSLCTKVSTFGVYDKIEPLTFNANEGRRCVIYCEVDGFLSQLNADQMWDTKLSLELRVFDARGLLVHQFPADETRDSANRRRRDFFLAKIIDLPKLSGGQYMLKAEVRDLQSNRVDQKTILFTVKSKESVPE